MHDENYVAELQEKVDMATRSACEALKELEKEGKLARVSPVVRAWYIEHQKRDQDQRQRQGEADFRVRLNEATDALKTAVLSNAGIDKARDRLNKVLAEKRS